MKNNSMFNSSNPFLSEERINKASTTSAGPIERVGEFATKQGAIDKTLLLFGILLATTFYAYTNANPMFYMLGAIGGLIAVIATVMKPSISPYSAPIYAALEGLFVGAISAKYALAFEGIVFQAVSLTMGTLLTMLMVYRSGLIKVTSKFRTGVIMATGAVFLVYIISFIGSFVGFNVPYIHEGGMMGIGITVVIIGVAAMNLLLDFDNFDRVENANSPKYMEWFLGMGLMITLVWLYVEFLRLLSKIKSD